MGTFLTSLDNSFETYLTHASLRRILGGKVERIMARRKFHRHVAAFTAVLVLTGGIAIFAQGTPTPGNPAGEASTKNETCCIQGTVVAAASGEPLRGVRLVLSPIGQGKQKPEPKSGTTDGEGRFLITAVAAGSYHFLAAKTGYVKQAYPVRGAAVNLIPEHPSPYRSDLARTAATDPHGHFVIPDVVPGRYRALAATSEDNESDHDGDDPGAQDGQPGRTGLLA